MRNKKIKTPLFLAASLLLVGCSSDTIVARPDWIDKDIISVSDIKDNKLKSIYDAVKQLGDTNSAVLTNIMYKISKTYIGDYYEDIQKYVNMDETTAIGDEGFKTFIKNHTIYQSGDKGASMVDREKNTIVEETFTENDKLIIAYRNLKAKYEQINEDIAEKLYEDIKGGSYNNTNTKTFNERYFVEHLRKELYLVDSQATYNSGMPIMPKKTQEQTYNKIIDNYLNRNLTFEHEGKTYYRYQDYIERKILPELYKNYLTELYVKEQRYSSLGRSYARKVNMIAVPYTASTTTATSIDSMLKWYAQTYITGKDDTEQYAINDAYNLNDINDAMIGFEAGVPNLVQSTEPETLTMTHKLLNYTIENEPADPTNWYKRTNFTKLCDSSDNVIKYHSRTDKDGVRYTDSYTVKDDANYTYVYKGTKLGDMMEKLLKFTDIVNNGGKETFKLKSNRSSDEETAYNDFTNNQAQSIEDSIVLREQEARATNYLKNGWYLKNGGLTDLDTDFRDHLFNISTSTTIDNFKKLTGEQEYGSSEYVKYFGKVKDKGAATTDFSNRKAFLTTSKDKIWQTVVLQGKSNYFIVEVQEAPNTSKLSTNAENSNSYINIKTYEKTKDAKPTLPTKYTSTESMNEIIRQVVKANSSSDTYKKNANQYYLMISNIVFYDQSVYDYFKSQFPDLFK